MGERQSGLCSVELCVGERGVGVSDLDNCADGCRFPFRMQYMLAGYIFSCLKGQNIILSRPYILFIRSLLAFMTWLSDVNFLLRFIIVTKTNLKYLSSCSRCL